MIEYNNNPLSFKGKLSRTAYVFTNLSINMIAFRFLYYPGIMSALHANPEFKFILSQISKNPDNNWLLPYLKYVPETMAITVIVKLLFLIPFRIIDIKRLRDILNRELKKKEFIFFCILFSLPYMDFFSTLFLSILKPGKAIANISLSKEIYTRDLKEADKENAIELNKRLFESGRISRAEFVERRKKQSLD